MTNRTFILRSRRPMTFFAIAGAAFFSTACEGVDADGQPLDHAESNEAFDTGWDDEAHWPEHMASRSRDMDAAEGPLNDSVGCGEYKSVYENRTTQTLCKNITFSSSCNGMSSVSVLLGNATQDRQDYKKGDATLYYDVEVPAGGTIAVDCGIFTSDKACCNYIIDSCGGDDAYENREY